MVTDFALHITWTTYGTWLPGDARGYVSNTLTSPHGYSRRRNRPTTPYTKDNFSTRSRSGELQKWPTVYLDEWLALIVAESLVEAAIKRLWHVAQAAVICNHVHVVVSECPADGPAVRRVLKGVTQAKLCDAAGQNRHWWTTGGSNRYKNDRIAIENAIQYVADQEGMLAGVCGMKPFVVIEGVPRFL